MGSKKYFFFDYDGTLAVPRTRSIPQSTLEALDELRAQGHFIALATGRLQVNAVDYIDSAGITNIVADGGYSVTLNGELKWMEGLPLAPVKKCLHILEDQGIPWAVSTTNELVRYSPREDFAEIAGDYYVPTEYDPNLRIDDLTAFIKRIYLVRPRTRIWCLLQEPSTRFPMCAMTLTPSLLSRWINNGALNE